MCPACCYQCLHGNVFLNASKRLSGHFPVLDTLLFLTNLQDITAKWEKLRHPATTAAQKFDVVHDILDQVRSLTF